MRKAKRDRQKQKERRKRKNSKQTTLEKETYRFSTNSFETHQ
jgi:hypothetical protein